MISHCTWSGNLPGLQTCYAHSHLLPVPLHNPLPQEGQINLVHKSGSLSREVKGCSWAQWHSWHCGEPIKQKSGHPQCSGLGLSSLVFKSQGKTCDSCLLPMDTLHWNMVFCLPASLHHAAILWMERKGSPLHTNEAYLKLFKRKSLL